jgi:hypothetical protein
MLLGFNGVIRMMVVGMPFLDLLFILMMLMMLMVLGMWVRMGVEMNVGLWGVGMGKRK